MSQCQKNTQGNPTDFQKNSGIKNFMDTRGVGYQAFPPKIQIFQNCCFKVPKKFVGEQFCVSENFWYGNILWIRGGGREYHDFPSKLFCLRVLENFVEDSFCVSGNFWYGKILWIRGGREGVSRFSVETFLPHSTGEFRRRFLLCFRNFLVTKNLFHARGKSRLFVENF